MGFTQISRSLSPFCVKNNSLPCFSSIINNRQKRTSHILAKFDKIYPTRILAHSFAPLKHHAAMLNSLVSIFFFLEGEIYNHVFVSVSRRFSLDWQLENNG